MIKNLFITILTCVFLLVGGNAFGASLEGSVEGAFGGVVVFNGEYTISGNYNDLLLEQETVFNYYDLSSAPGMTVDGQLVYNYTSKHSQRKIKGDTTIIINDILYNISMDITVNDYQKPTGYLCIDGISYSIGKNLIKVIDMIYFSEMYLLIP